MPLDPRLILGAVSPPGASKPFDPITTMGNIAQTQGLVQQQQIGQLQLADAQRAEQERGTLARAFQDPRARVTDPATGVTTVDVPKALGLALTTSRNPLGIVKVQAEYGKSQAENRKAQLDATKAQLDTTAAQLDISGRIANGIEQSIAAGTDPNAAWTAGLEEMRRNGIPTPSAPPTYDKGFLEQWKGKALTQKDAIAAQQNGVAQKLREQEVEETKKRTALIDKQYQLDVKRHGTTEAGQRRQEAAQEETARHNRAMEAHGASTAGAAASGRTFEQEDKLRNDFIAQTKPYQVQSEFYGRIETAAKDPSAAGDLALIYSFMKLLDPGSTVLAGEYATAANAGSIPERIYSQYNRLVSGELLGEAEKGTIRKDYVDRARRIYEQSTKDYERTKAVFDDRARRYQLNPANVTQDLGTTASGAGGAAAPAGPKVLREEDIARTIEDSKTAGRPVTREQVIEEGRKRGFQVP